MATNTRIVTVYDRIYKHLFDDKQGTKLSTDDYAVKQRIQAAFIKKIDNPTIPDKMMVRYIMETFDVSLRTAYNDINAIETIYGNVRKANKEYVRFMVTETQKEVISIEKSRLSKNLQEFSAWENHTRDDQGNLPPRPEHYSTKDLTNAVSVLARANNLDKEDPNIPNWNEVQPPIIEPTDDITIMDLEPVPDGTIKRLKEKYLGKMSDIQEAESV